MKKQVAISALLMNSLQEFINSTPHMKHTPILALLVASFFGTSAYALTANTITLTSPSDTAYTTNKLTVSATATAGTPSITVTGPATFALGKITLTGIGSVSVVAKETTAPAGYALPTPVTNSFNVRQASQTISNFPTIPSTNWGTNVPVITVPIPKSSSGLPVTLSVIQGGTLTSTNKVTASGAGTIIVAANQSGNANYAAASQVTANITVNQGSNSITAFGAASPTNPVYGSSFTIPVPTGRSSSPVQVTATGASVSVSGSTATVTPNAAGPVTVYANQAGDLNWKDATQIQKVVTVGKKTPVISPAGDRSYTFSSQLAPVTITPTSTSSGAFSFSVTGPATVVTNTGVVTITGAGSIVVKAQEAASADGNYAAVTNAVTVSTITVSKGNQSITVPNIPTPANGTSFTLPLLNSDQGLACTYGVSGATYAATTRKVTVSTAGTISITASQAGTNNYLPIGPVNVVSFTATKTGSIFSFSKQ